MFFLSRGVPGRPACVGLDSLPPTLRAPVEVALTAYRASGGDRRGLPHEHSYRLIRSSPPSATARVQPLPPTQESSGGRLLESGGPLSGLALSTAAAQAAGIGAHNGVVSVEPQTMMTLSTDTSPSGPGGTTRFWVLDSSCDEARPPPRRP